MLLPKYSEFEPPKVELAEAAISVIGEEQLARQAHIIHPSDNHLNKASDLAGQVCISIAEKDHGSKTKKILTDAKATIKAAEDGSIEGKPELAFAYGSIKTILEVAEFRRQPKRLDRVRGELFTSTIDRMQHYYDQENSGLFAEQATLALLNRYRHPWLISLQALPNHEGGPDVHNNYDLTAVEVSPYVNDVSAYKLQVKASCLGYCDQGRGSGSLAEVRHYSSSITMVSGCCDLNIYGNDEERIDRRKHLLDLLDWERRGLVTDNEIKYLDQLTDNLLFSISSDPRRRGQFGLNESSI